MTEVTGTPRRRLLSCVCVLLSAHFAVAYNTLTIPMVAFQPDREMTGAIGPFAYRMLPTLLWKGVTFLLGPVHRSHPALHMPHLNAPFTSDQAWFVAVLTFAAMLGTLTVARRLLRSIDGHWGFEWMVLGIGYVAYFDTILVLNRNLYYPYDVSALFFFTLLVTLAYWKRPVWFTLALMLAVLNKETAIMAVPVYLGLQYGRQPLARLIGTCTAMGAAAAGLRLAQRVYLLHHFSGNKGMVENQLSDNLHQLHNPLFWLSESSMFGFAWVAAVLFWRFVPVRVRVTALTVFGTWLAGMVFVGILREVRIFSELSALLLLVVALGVHGWLEERRRSLVPA